jgi:hypothetical protein
MRWVEALKIWNDTKDTWCIPKKGSKGYDEVMAIMMGKEEKPCPPCPKPRKAKSRSPSPKPKPKKRVKVEKDLDLDDLLEGMEDVDVPKKAPRKKADKPKEAYIC